MKMSGMDEKMPWMEPQSIKTIIDDILVDEISMDGIDNEGELLDKNVMKNDTISKKICNRGGSTKNIFVSELSIS